jgi:hypothetical protein
LSPVASARVRVCVRVGVCVHVCVWTRAFSLRTQDTPHSLAVALTVTHNSLCDERTRTHEVYRCTVHSRHQGPRGTHAQLLPSRRALLARHALCVSALRLGAARLYESRAPALGATAATACSAVWRLLLMSAAAQSCPAGERWHTARRRRRRPPRWLSLLSRRRFASRRRQLLRRESSEATYAPPLCGSSKERTRWQSCWLHRPVECEAR